MKFIFWLFILCTIGTEAMASTSTLKVTVTNLRSKNGYVAATLFSEEESSGFPRKSEQAIAKKYVKIDEGHDVPLVFENLPPGVYALAIMHDENADGTMRMMMGIPREGFGFSNNPRIFFGPPSFKKASVHVDQPETKIDVAMKYLL